ncbi:unnamed protein product [Closterium sp. NIES-54]
MPLCLTVYALMPHSLCLYPFFQLYPVGASFYAPPAFLIERAAVPLFGTKAYGVHMNGYTHLPSSSSSLHLWVARRSPLKPTFPNQLDHLVAGGQPHGISCRDNMIKECEEEADIPRHLAERAVPVGVVSYEIVTAANTLKRDVLFCYDLLLPPDFTPRNTGALQLAFVNRLKVTS